MSYCRFSSSNWMCDVYTYEHCGGGFVTHVAGRRRPFPPIPDLPHRWWPNFGGKFVLAERRVVYPSKWRAAGANVFAHIWVAWHRLSMWSLDLIPLRDIGLPHDGEAFSDDTATECADRLESLKAMGYNVPQYAIDALREEAEEAQDGK